jgi:hypothetical protein
VKWCHSTNIQAKAYNVGKLQPIPIIFGLPRPGATLVEIHAMARKWRDHVV